MVGMTVPTSTITDGVTVTAYNTDGTQHSQDTSGCTSIAPGSNYITNYTATRTSNIADSVVNVTFKG